MVNNSKIKLMTKLAIFEKRHRFDLQLGKYFKGDYIKFNLIKTVLCVTGGYILCLLLVGFYNIEYFIKEAITLDYKKYGIKILGIYAILLLIFCMISMITCNEVFVTSRKRLNKYYRKLKQLGKMYTDAENENKNIKDETANE